MSTAAAGVLLTVTGIAGGLCFAVWAAGDWLWVRGLRPNIRVPAPTTST